MDVVAESRWFSIVRADEIDDFITSGSGQEVMVVARDDQDRILLIEEPSCAFGDHVYLLPGGVVEPGESAETSGLRELREEGGFGARELTEVGVLRPWSKYLKVACHIVLAEQLFAAPLPRDEVHDIPVHWKTLAELRAMILDGAITDARVVAALALCFDADGNAVSRRRP